MDVQTIKRIWALELDYSGPDFMARAAIKGGDLELLETLLEHCGTEAFHGAEKQKTATDAVIAASTLGRVEMLDWLLSKGISTMFESDTFPKDSFQCRAIEMARAQGQVECLQRLYDHFGLYDARVLKVATGSGGGDPLSVFISSLGNSIKRDGMQERVDVIEKLVHDGKLVVGPEHAAEALKLGLHEVLPLLIEKGSAVDLKRVVSGTSGEKTLEGVSNERIALCFDALRQTHARLKLGSAGRLFCTVAGSSFGSAEKVEPLDKRTLPTKHALVVQMFHGLMSRKHDAPGYEQMSRALFELWSAVLPEALDARVAARAADKRDAKLLDAILSMGVKVTGTFNTSAGDHVSQGCIQQLVDDAEVARVLHKHGVDLEAPWIGRWGDQRKEHSILTQALFRGKDEQIPLIHALHELGVDFERRIGGRTITQHATNASDSVKRLIKAIKTGGRIERAFGEPEAGDPQEQGKPQPGGFVL